MVQQQRAEETRSHIIRVAVETFSRNGYEGTGVAEICREAGISKGAFYHHFPSKHDLYLVLLNNWTDSIDARLRHIREQSSTVPQALDAMTGVFKDIFRSSRNQVPIFFEFLTKASRDQSVRTATTASYERYSEYFAQIIEQGMQEGTVRATDPKTTAQILVSLAFGLVFQGLLDPGKADWSLIAEESIRQVIRDLIQV